MWPFTGKSRQESQLAKLINRVDGLNSRLDNCRKAISKLEPTTNTRLPQLHTLAKHLIDIAESQVSDGASDYKRGHSVSTTLDGAEHALDFLDGLVRNIATSTRGKIGQSLSGLFAALRQAAASEALSANVTVAGELVETASAKVQSSIRDMAAYPTLHRSDLYHIGVAIERAQEALQPKSLGVELVNKCESARNSGKQLRLVG